MPGIKILKKVIVHSVKLIWMRLELYMPEALS